MALCDKCCTTTSPGRPRQRCPVITGPPMMFRRDSASHAGHGTDSKGNTLRLTPGVLALTSNFPTDHRGGTTLPAEDATVFCGGRPVLAEMNPSLRWGTWLYGARLRSRAIAR